MKGMTMEKIDYSKYENATPRQLTRYYDSAIFQMKKREKEAQMYAELAKFLSTLIARAYSAPSYHKKQEKYLRPNELTINKESNKNSTKNSTDSQRIKNEVLQEMGLDSASDY